MEMVKQLASKAEDTVKKFMSMPPVGEPEDIEHAKELIGEDSHVYAALRVPPEFYELACIDYCKLAFIPCLLLGRISANRAFDATLYIVTESDIKVHVDPFKPPLAMAPIDRAVTDLKLDDIKEVNVIHKPGTCCDPRDKTGLRFEESGSEIYISDPETLSEIIQKVRQYKGEAENALAQVEAAQEKVDKAEDEGKSGETS